LVTDLDLTLEDAVGQARLVREGAVSSADLVTAAIARIEAVNPVINAVVTPLFEFALSTPSAPGPFQGVPFLLKDAGACLAGLPLYAGSGLLRSLSSAAPADTVLGARFRDAGFAFVGKTNLPEFGIQPTTQPLAFGPTRNPWDTSRSSGGSSGGAAAAVAAGMVPVAHAGDIGGSIRIPSAWCGVVGLKPSRGRTSTVPLVDPNMVEHVITRSVRDCAAVLDAVAGATESDVYQLPSSDAAYGGLGESGPLRIGLMTHVDAGAIDVDPECVQAAERTGSLLESLGHNVERAGPTALFNDEFATHSHAVMTREMKVVLDGLAATVGRPLVAADVEPYTWAMAAEGAAVTNDQYANGQIWERAYTARISTWWTEGFDLLLTPATATPPLPLESLVPPADSPLSTLPIFQSIWCFAIPFNVTGQPAISIPGERSADGLPIGCQLVAPLGREDLLLQVAGQLEAAAPARRATVATPSEPPLAPTSRSA